MRFELSGDMVFDTSAVLELIDETKLGVMLKEKLESDSVFGHLTEVSISEAMYIICRRLGMKESSSRIGSLIESGYFQIEASSALYQLAAKYKCVRSISIADCFCLAAGENLKLPVLFATRERELKREMKVNPFQDVDVIFLEDFQLLK
jgi:uncharacterized protein with PIN domain